MYLLIDYREKDFINKLSEFVIIENDIVKSVVINNITLKFKITCLEIGDFIIQKSLDEIDSIVLCIERKSISDLCASIKDSRFREQKQRLLESLKDPMKICYLIENESNKKVLSDNIINGAILNLIFKHNYKVVNTKNKLDTFNNIMLLYKKFQNDDFNVILSQDFAKIKLIKKSEKIESEKMINQLCLISGVSIVIAESIIQNIKTVTSETVTIKILIEMYNKLEAETEKEMMFSNVYITDKRKVGKALSKKIYEYFCV